MITLTGFPAFLHASFILVFISFVAAAGFFVLEKDRVPEDFRLPIRVSIIYLAIAAINYYYMQNHYGELASSGERAFPTHFRYIDWILTTPLMLVEFPLILGLGKKGRSFMTRLVVLDLLMITFGYVGELTPHVPLAHYGFFLLGCIAWVLIVVLLFSALASLPEQLEDSVRKGVRRMGAFVVAGWAIYPLGYFAPLLQLPPEARELIYNIADLVNKVGLCLLVYATAKMTAMEREDEMEGYEDAYPEEMAPAGAYGAAYPLDHDAPEPAVAGYVGEDYMGGPRGMPSGYSRGMSGHG